MLKIRLMRIGAKKRPFYRVVAVDERAKRTGGYVELLGTYNPLTEPKAIKLKQDRIDYWIKQGAQTSVGYLRIIGKAPQRPPRKAKKEKKVEEPAKVVEVTEETKVTEVTEEKTSETSPSISAETQPENNEKEEVMDDSANKPESTETVTSESVQNKNEGSA